MGVLGELFPGPKITDEAGEAGDGQRWRLGPVDLENGVVELRRMPAADEADVERAADAAENGAAENGPVENDPAKNGPAETGPATPSA